jgi:hypothetical protein
MWRVQSVFASSLSMLCLIGGSADAGGEETERPASARTVDANVLTDDEVQQGFVYMFDGVSFDGWKHDGNWEIQEGAFVRVRKGESLTYVAQTVPDDFELRFEWKVSKGCNSGVYYRPGQVEWGISALNDQGVAGTIMMVESSIVTVLLLGWLFVKAARESEEKQSLLELARARGVELSERRAARAVASGRGEELRRRLERAATG